MNENEKLETITVMQSTPLFSVFRAIILILAGLLVYTCARNPVTGKSQIMLISEEQEIKMGESYDPQVVSEMGTYSDEKIQQFIAEKGQAMAKISHRPNLPWTFRVVDSPVVNAFAVPGGYVYFTRGILAHFNNEAQFAGVLGHEIGHVTARHTASQQSKQTLAQVGLVAGMIASPRAAQMFGDMAGQAMQLLFLKFSRDDESQSDQLGVEYSSKIGYNSHEMADFFRTLSRLSAQSGQIIPDFLSTHPNPDNRYERVHELTNQWQTKLSLNPANLKVGRESYLRLIDGIVYGEDPRQGYEENNVFYHPELKFQFPVPSDWVLKNSSSQVLMMTQDQKALMVLQLGQGASPRDAAETFLQKNELQATSSQETTINGNPAYVVLAKASDQQGTSYSLLNTFIKYNDIIYHFLGYTYEQSYGTYEPSFRQAMQGFKALSDPAKINVQPERIRVKTITRATTLSAALRDLGTPDNRMEELAILNGMELNDQLAAGTMIKVVGK